MTGRKLLLPLCGIALCVIVFSRGMARADVLLDRIVAIVNQEVITWIELYRAMEDDSSQAIREMKEEDRRRKFKESEAAYLESYINGRLQIQEARNLGLRVSDEELDEAIASIKAKYSMADAAFRESLAKEGLTYEGYRKRLRDQILISKVVNQQVRSKIIVTDEDAARFLRENRELAEGTESYRISQIFLKRRPDGSDKALLEAKAQEVMGRLASGEDFRALAKRYSEDASATAGGDLGWIERAVLGREFIETLSGMKAGDVSSPFWTERGLHIIRLDEKKEPKKVQESMEEAKKTLGNKLFMERYNAWIKSLRERSFIEIRL